MDDFIVNYLLHFQISTHTTIPDVHESARDVLKACIMVVMFCKWYCCKDITASALNFRCYNFIILCMRDFHNVAITIKFISKISVLTYVWFTYLVILVALQQYLYLLKAMTDLDTRIRSAFTLRLTNYLEEYMSAKNRW